MLDMFRHPEQWQESRSRTNVMKLYAGQTMPGGWDLCGNNTLENLISVVPGGAFRWLNQNNIRIAIETGAVKECSCGRNPDTEVAITLNAISGVRAGGASVDYIAMDEPFNSGLPGQHDFADPKLQCGYSVEQTAKMTKYYVDAVHRSYPNIQIGLIEPYAYFTVEQIKSFILALENNGYRIPFFHLDFDPVYNVNFGGDIAELADFCRSKGIKFGVIIIGGDGSSTQTATAGSYAAVERISAALGSVRNQDYILVQSWLANPAVPKGMARDFPLNLPESDPATMTGFLNTILKKY